MSLLRSLKGHKKLALASASYSASVECVVSTLGIGHFFDIIAAHGDVARLKPFPDVFLFVAEKLGSAPAACVVLEDSEKGVLAASAAGMRCIAVPNRHTRNHDFSKATLVVASLEDVSLHLIDSL